jgi:outer membrane immunogenic protein
MNKISVKELAFILAFLFPNMTLADEKQLEKRLEALEAKMERMGAIEAENKELRIRLQKTEAKLEKVTAQKIATVAPVRTMEPQATPVTVATPVITKGVLVTPVSTESNWSGVYAGINAGYSQGFINIARDGYGFGNFNFDRYSTYVEGPVVGGQIGLNHQFSNNIVLGIEADFDWADVVARNFSSNGDYGSGNSSGISTGSYNSRYGLDWLGTGRARLGYAFANLMPFITGGIAYGQLTSNEYRWYNSALGFSCCGLSSTSSSFTSGTASNVNVGWVAGAGVEYLLPNSWSLKGEYQYAYLGNLTRSDEGYFAAIPSFAGYTKVNINNFGVHQARVGLNYHTDWLKSYSVNTEEH